MYPLVPCWDVVLADERSSVLNITTVSQTSYKSIHRETGVAYERSAIDFTSFAAWALEGFRRRKFVIRRARRPVDAWIVRLAHPKDRQANSA